MKVKTKVFYFALLICVVGMVSCTDKIMPDLNNVQSSNTQSETLIPSTAQAYDASKFRILTEESVLASEEFAILLALSLKDSEFRKFIKNEANKRIDGDYDILVSDVVDASINGIKFTDHISYSSAMGQTFGDQILNKALLNKRLNIAIPLWIDRWDETKTELLVAVGNGASEKETKYLKAFDSNGNVFLIDAQKEPNLPVIVVGNNERMGYKSKTAIKNSNDNFRVSGLSERITYIRVTDLNDIESWWLGGPEIQFDAVVYNNDFSAAFQAASAKRSNPTRDNAKSGYNLDLGLFEWYFDENHGPDYFLQVGEMDDSGSTFKFSVGVTVGKKDVVSGSASFEITYKKQDRKLPSELIHYTSASPRNISDYRIKYTLENGYSNSSPYFGDGGCGSCEDPV